MLETILPASAVRLEQQDGIHGSEMDRTRNTDVYPQVHGRSGHPGSWILDESRHDFGSFLTLVFSVSFPITIPLPLFFDPCLGRAFRFRTGIDFHRAARFETR